MKLQQLTIHNIASIEDAVIDFEAQPLSDSEVFLITGNTGSGKSTILDAICLALFANTPRLDNTRMQGKTKDGSNGLSIGDPRQLLRRDAGEGFVQLTFIGSNRVRYQAEWSVRRANDRPSGALQAKKWKLTNLDMPQADALRKDDDIKAEMEKAVGLSFDQFCRTTLLAQGEFTRFLNSKDNEKAEILEKLTNKPEYALIGAKVREVFNSKAQAWESARQQVADVVTLTDEQIAQLNEQTAALDKQSKEIESANRLCITKLQWLETEQKLSASVTDAKNAYDKVIAAMESEAFQRTEKTLSEWNDTMDARQYLAALNEASKNEQECLAEQNRLTAQAGVLQQNLQKALEVSRKAESDCTEYSRQLQAAEESLEAMRMPQLREEFSKTKDLLGAISIARTHLHTLAVETQRRVQAKQEIDKRSETIQSKKAEMANLSEPVRLAKSRMDTARELFDAQKDTIDKFASAWRQKLHVGDICPVCRQKITDTLPHEEDLKQLVDGLQTAYTQAENAYNDLMAQQNRLDAEIRSFEDANRTAQIRYDSDTSVAQAEQNAKMQLRRCGIDSADNAEEQLNGVEQRTTKQLQQLEAQIQQGEQSEKQLRAQRDTLNRLRTEKDQRLLAYTQAQQAVTQHNGKTETTQRLLCQAQERKQNAQAALDAFFLSHPLITPERLMQLAALSAQTVAQHKEAVERTKNEQLSRKTLWESALQAQQEHQLSKPVLTEADTPAQLRQQIDGNTPRINALNQEIGDIRGKLRTDEEKKTTLGQLILREQEAKREYDRWQRLDNLIGDATGNTFRRIAQSYVLASLIHSANSYMHSLTDRYVLKVEPGTFVITLEDAYQGYASRAASTISGGESFLVSLSLALALSDIGQQLAVDTLFIDEGFGTLSGEPLQNAINTLRLLHDKSGRHVGIISHVEELQERIPVQIQVRQNAKASSSTIQIVPETE